MRQTADALIVGGGPAGLTTAIAMQRLGMRVWVLDKRRPPIDKACGEGLMPSGLAALARLGLRLPTTAGMPLRGIRYLDGPRQLEAAFTKGEGRGIRRLLLQQSLADEAQRLGVTLRWACQATGLRPDGLETTDGAMHARYLIGADGLHSQVRRWAGWDWPQRLLHERRCFALRQHFWVAPWSDQVEVHWGDGFEAYVTPVASDQVGIAILTGHPLHPLPSYLEALPSLKQRLASALPASNPRGAGPLWQPTRAVTDGQRLALVGDAAGYLDAITGEGLALAFCQAEALANAIAANALITYSQAHRRIQRWPNRLTHVALLLRRWPQMRRWLFQGEAATGRPFAALVGRAAGAGPATFTSGFSNARVRGPMPGTSSSCSTR